MCKCSCKCECKPVSEQNPNFQVGDVVEWCGVEGIVKEVLAPNFPYPIVCMFGDYKAHFREDGRYAPWHTKPSLTLVSRPKRKCKVKKTITRWANVYSDGVMWDHNSKERADQDAVPGRIVCVELTGTYEVEE